MTPEHDALAVGEAGRRPARVVVASLLALTKPGVIELLLITAIPALLVAHQGLPPVPVLLVTVAGEILAAASASTVGCYRNRDIGAGLWPGSHRAPTAARTAAGQGTPVVGLPGALAFGLALGAAATLLLGLGVNWRSAVLADASILVFALACTLGRKRWPPGRVVGAAAACFPLLPGWAAVTGTVTIQVTVLAAMIFCWAPPRLWALALGSRDDYAVAQADGPAAAASIAAGAREVLWYSAIVVGATFGVAPYAGVVYTVCAVAVGTWFLAEGYRLRARADRISGSASVPPGAGVGPAMSLTGLSLVCLAQLLAAIMAAVVLLPRSR